MGNSSAKTLIAVSWWLLVVGPQVLAFLAVALQVGVIVGQAPFLKAENQCGALYDRK
jgi:hypothetical protein